MAKKKYTTEYFDLDRMLNVYDTSYYMIYGQREDGKSYSVKKEIIKTIKNGNKFIYLRRLHQHIVRTKMVKVFDDIQHLFEKEFGSKIYYDSQSGFYLMNDGEMEIVGYVASIEDAIDAKSIPLVNIKTILFDEFIDYRYLQDEIPKFLHTISTICRPPNENVKVFMLGNTISKVMCPYFTLFGIDPSKIKQGEIYYIKHNLGVTASVQHTPTKVDDIVSKRKTNKYIGFDDNASVNMIMFGEWEYQHCITKYIDGIGWNCMRHFIPIYFTAYNCVYEFTINTDIQIPILFIRKVNIQLGKCGTKVKYNLSFDNSVTLVNKNGIVPSLSKINDLIDKTSYDKWKLALKCMECGRVIFDTIETGSELQSMLKQIG